MATEKLSTRAEALGDMLSVLGRLTTEAGALLDVLGGSLGTLGALTAPIHSRAAALTAAQRNVAATKAEADALLDHLDTSRRVGPTLAAGPAADLPAFLEALEALERSVAFLQGHARLAAVQAALGAGQALFNRALETCHADFAATLAAAARDGAPPPAWLQRHLGDAITEESRESLTRDLAAPEQLPKLRRMAQIMLDAAYDPVKAGYVAARERALAAALRAAGPEAPAPGALAALAPDALERAVAAWGRRLRAVALLALSERRLARGVWPEPESGELFVAAVGRQLRALLQAGRDIVEARRAPEKLFALLDMHGQLLEVMPALGVALADAPTPGDADAAPGSRRSTGDAGGGSAGGRGPELAPPAAALVSECGGLAALVARAAAALFGEYEELVARDGSKVLPPDGTIHPQTAQVVSYVKRLLSYERAADVLFGPDGARGGSSAGGAGGGGAANAALRAAVARLLARLLENLESKARGYKGDAALGAVFMMNNVHYVQWSAEGGAAEALLGRDWLERHKDLVEDWGARYQDITWGPLVALLQADAPSDPARLKQHLKDTFGAFNAALERVYAGQSSWTVPDAALRDAMRRVVKNDVIQPYRDFMRKYAEVPFTATPAKYIKFTSGDIEALVDDDLFSGKVQPSSKLDLMQQKMAAII